jgi:hypothetical protein
MNYKEIKRYHDYYLCGASLGKTATRFGVCRKALHHAFQRLGMATRPLRSRNDDTVEVDGFNFTPDKDGYYRRTKAPRIPLHKYLYEKEHGALADGYILKFKDGDKKNYKTDNMMLIKWRQQ